MYRNVWNNRKRKKSNNLKKCGIPHKIEEKHTNQCYKTHEQHKYPKTYLDGNLQKRKKKTKICH